MRRLRAVDIDWDYEGLPPDEFDIPCEVEIPDDVDIDEVGDYLSDEFGFCHYGYKLVMTMRCKIAKEAKLVCRRKKKLNFVECLQLIDHLIREKILFQDPDNKNNVIVYREKGETSPEGWCSENIHTAARELANDEKAQLFLLEAYIEKTGKKIAFEDWLDEKSTSVSIVIEDYDGKLRRNCL